MSDPAALMDRACRLAGVLAERGIRDLVLVHADGSLRPLTPRHTDLPALLVSLNPGDHVRTAPRPDRTEGVISITIARSADGWVIASDDRELNDLVDRA